MSASIGDDNPPGSEGCPMSGRSWRRVGVGIVLLGAAVAGIVGYRAWTPEWMRREILRELEGIWGGNVVIEHPRYSPFGPLQIGAISFFDASGHPWARAEQVVLTLDGWPILGSPLREIRAETLHAASLAGSEPSHSAGPVFSIRHRQQPVRHDPRGSLFRGSD